jgi:hypothetical protein
MRFHPNRLRSAFDDRAIDYRHIERLHSVTISGIFNNHTAVAGIRSGLPNYILLLHACAGGGNF